MKISSLEELQNFAREFVDNLIPQGKNATVVALSGDLGAGKTTFVQSVGREFGITETINSPTFVIMSRYMMPNGKYDTLVHIDAYRLEGSSDLKKLGLEDLVQDPKNLIMIEWPEQVAEVLPQEVTKLEFTWVNETTREITYGN